MSNTPILKTLIQNKPISELAINGKEVKELYIDNKRIYSKLPPIYTELEYIESNSTTKQYLKTGIKPTANYTISVDFRLTKNTATLDTIFGTRNGNIEIFTARFNSKTGTEGTLGIQRSISSTATQYQSAELYDVTKTIAMNGFHNATFAKNIFYFDGVRKKSFSTSTSKTAFSYEWYLFALNDRNTATDFGSFQIKLCTIKDYDNKLVRHFIPCKNNNGTPGMYDYITGKFYKCANDNISFIPGPEV